MRVAGQRALRLDLMLAARLETKSGVWVCRTSLRAGAAGRPAQLLQRFEDARRAIRVRCGKAQIIVGPQIQTPFDAARYGQRPAVRRSGVSVQVFRKHLARKQRRTAALVHNLMLQALMKLVGR